MNLRQPNVKSGKRIFAIHNSAHYIKWQTSFTWVLSLTYFMLLFQALLPASCIHWQICDQSYVVCTVHHSDDLHEPVAYLVIYYWYRLLGRLVGRKLNRSIRSLISSYRRTRKLAIFKFSSKIETGKISWLIVRAIMSSYPQSLISSCGRDLINELVSVTSPFQSDCVPWLTGIHGTSG